jgi:hypothetical protein
VGKLLKTVANGQQFDYNIDIKTNILYTKATHDYREARSAGFLDRYSRITVSELLAAHSAGEYFRITFNGAQSIRHPYN